MTKVDEINQTVDNILEMQIEMGVLINRLLEEVYQYVEHS